MSDVTKVPALPSLNGVSDKATRDFLTAVKELLEVRDGRRGDALDQFVKVRDITDAGVATYNANRKKIVRPFPAEGDFTAPSALMHFAVSGGYTQMFLTWDVVNSLNYLNFSHVEIWRSATDALGAAVMIGETTASVYSDACGSSQTFYYWGRLVSIAGVKGPFNAVHGTKGETAIDVVYMLEKLSGAITESQLYRSLGDRINLIDAPETTLNSVNARVKTLRDTTTTSLAQVNSRVDVVESVDSDLIRAVNQIIVVDQGQAAEIYLEQAARISADNAQAVQISSLSASVGANAAAISAETTSRATGDSALANNLNVLVARVGTAESSITTEQTARVNADGALTSAVNTLSNSVNGHTTSIQTQQTVTDGLSAQFTVKIDASGYISGYGLASTPRDGTPFSEFYVRADRFAVGSPGQAGVVPFTVVTSPQIINGVTVPVGVYMEGAYIKDGTLVNSKFGNASIDDAKIANLSAAKVTFGFMSGDRVDVNTLSADRLITNTLAAKLASITTAYITDANVTSLNADKINAGTIKAAQLDSAIITAKVANLTSAQIESLDASKVSASSLSAISAIIGTLRSASSGARLEVTTDVIRVYDSSNILRVKLGNLA